MLPKHALLLLLLPALLAGCDLKTDDKINAAEVNRTIQERKIKRVLDDDLVAFAYAQGETAASALLPKLPLSDPDSLCRLLQPERLAQSAGIDWLAGVRLHCEPGFFFHPKEAEMWDAYAKALSDGTEAPPSVQRLGDRQTYQQLVYIQPVRYQRNGQPAWAMLSLLLDKKTLILQYKP